MSEPPGGGGRGGAGYGCGAADARAALAGNPSDGYRGAVLALALPGLRAEATATWRAPGAVVRSAPVPLVAATVSRFAAEHDRRAADAVVSWRTQVPRSVGLAGSSAIVIAVLRALGDLCAVSWSPGALAELALSIEDDDLGIPAGLQDRVAQAHGGLTFMDFSCDPPVYAPLRVDALPPLVVAWQPASGGDSGAVHAPLRARHAAGDPVVVSSMMTLADHARAAARALSTGDRVALRRAVDGSLDARAAMITLDPRHLAMVHAARAAGAAVNYAGSGGAVVAACDDRDQRAAVQAALCAIGCATLAI